MYVGLNLTYASSFQMLRGMQDMGYLVDYLIFYSTFFLGAVIIFTGLLSTAFLGRLLKHREWLGMFTVICGLSIVGASDFIYGNGNGTSNSLNNIITGDLLIVMAQIISALQMVCLLIYFDFQYL